ncbi:polymorphic toxin-type HINT domain-containing protein [Lignipirellula cremea]|uniref:Intein C-terminal splicing domain-containing protein n=1 Tax=Lignipirellula cremea TaxID=2528010 RepID=A0A518DV03_9BACT|nr:polymorphic toxin-type HINT domain-containing protein [Lignipirellula cremea]QDU95666.1 hypothetical protein Pla8534_34830 [Lignipirellula cremea]
MASYAYGFADGLTGGALSAVAEMAGIDVTSITSSWAYTVGYVVGFVQQVILTGGASATCGLVFRVFQGLDVILGLYTIGRTVHKIYTTGEVTWWDAFNITMAVISIGASIRKPNCFIAGTQVLVADHVLEVAAETTEDLLTLLLPSLTIVAGAATLAGVGLAIHRRKKQQDGRPPGGPPRRSTTQNLLENGAQLMDDLVDDVLYGFDASPAPQLAGLPVDWEDFMDDALRQATQAPLPATTPAPRPSFSFDEPETPAAFTSAPSTVTETGHPSISSDSSSREKSSRWLNGGILCSLLLTLLFGSAWAWNANREKPAPTATTQTVYTTKNIEDVRPGDTVVSFNEETGENEPAVVGETFDRICDQLRILEINTTEGGVQHFETTDEHPFYTVEGAWVNAGDLKVSDQIQTRTGQLALICGTRSESRAKAVAVYNFSVIGNHTYYVVPAGDSLGAVNNREAAEGFLVHNNCGPNVALGKQGRGPQPRQLRDFAKARGGYYFEEWFDQGITSSRHFSPKTFSEALDAAKRIDIDLTGVLKEGDQLPMILRVIDDAVPVRLGSKGITEWEIYQVMTNPKWAMKAHYWIGNVDVSGNSDLLSKIFRNSVRFGQ